MRRNWANDPFGLLTAEELAKYEGKWIIAVRGKVRGVGDTLDEAFRRARLPKGATPVIWRILREPLVV